MDGPRWLAHSGYSVCKKCLIEEIKYEEKKNISDQKKKRKMLHARRTSTGSIVGLAVVYPEVCGVRFDSEVRDPNPTPL